LDSISLSPRWQHRRDPAQHRWTGLRPAQEDRGDVISSDRASVQW